jgi:serine/threonine protein kinase
MSNDLQDRAREIFFACVRRHTPHERAEFIERECGGDDALQSAVVNLIEANEANGSFLEQPFDGVPAERSDGELAATLDMPPATEQAGSKIGPYKLLQQIGEGGFGVVYMAQQTQPVRR